MPEVAAMKLQIIDGLRLPAEFRNALKPGGALRDNHGHSRVLPRFFYEIPSWEAAKETQLTPNLGLWEFIQTDVREAEPLRSFPRYVPCAVTLMAMALQRFRDKVGPVHIATNGGYRSPQHALTCRASLHCWATAVDVYRVGDNLLDNPDKINRCASLAREVVPGVSTHPSPDGAEETDDHLHLDIGFVLAVPHHVRVDSGLLEEVVT
ncbi:MAG: hypothetical protein ACR2IE_07645 [Candidatus Sumerlaeaceae bacterium]